MECLMSLKPFGQTKVMKVSVRPIGTVKEFCRPHELHILGDETYLQILQQLDLPSALKVTIFVNGKRKNIEDIVTPEEKIQLVSILRGG